MRHLPSSFDRYIEPFAGSACLFFAQRPVRPAWLNDVNAELIDTYREVRSHPRMVARSLAVLPDSPEEYLRQRALRVQELALHERAVRFLYLNRHCFNGVYRTNREGLFNVPRGRRQGSVPTEEALYRCSVALRRARITSYDFSTVVSNCRKRDFLYLDPPYSRAARPHYGLYGYEAFSCADDETRLLTDLTKIDSRGATFVLSYSPTDEDPFTSAGYFKMNLAVRRSVAAKVDARATTAEYLYSNRPFAPQSASVCASRGR